MPQYFLQEYEQQTIGRALTAYEAEVDKVVKATEKIGLDASIARARIVEIGDCRRALDIQMSLDLKTDKGEG